MTVNSYNQAHWAKRIPSYLQDSWSNQPTPFAELAATYFPENARILELGTGAGQDGLWFASQGYDVTMSDASEVGFGEIKNRAKQQRLNSYGLTLQDITHRFSFPDSHFNVVYAQLVLHYFDNETMHKIIGEIRRVLKRRGILACMVNSVNDSEYKQFSGTETPNLIKSNGLTKRFFSIESFASFVDSFKPILFDNSGRTPKDDAIGTRGLIQFIGVRE